MTKTEKIPLAERLASQGDIPQKVKATDENIGRIIDNYLFSGSPSGEKEYDRIMSIAKHIDNISGPTERLKNYYEMTVGFYENLKKNKALMDLPYKQFIDYLPMPFNDFGSIFTDMMRIADPPENYILHTNKWKWGTILYRQLNYMKTNPDFTVRDVLDYEVVPNSRAFSVYINDFGDYIGMRQARYIFSYIGIWLPLYEYCYCQFQLDQ